MSPADYQPEADHYSLLEISPSATAEEVKRAFYRAVRKVHPDLNIGRRGSTGETQRINEAKILLNPVLRSKYDRMRDEYWAERDQRPSQPRRAKTRRSRRPSTPQRRATEHEGDEPWNRLAMAFLQGLMGER